MSEKGDGARCQTADRLPPRKDADRGQRTLDHIIRDNGWQLLLNHRHASDVTLSYKEAGGGGDCFFHSVSAALRPHVLLDVPELRNLAASAVTPENVADAVCDIAAECPETTRSPMQQLGGRDVPPGSYDPAAAWNACGGDMEALAASLRAAVCTRGNYFWGNATVASLLEEVLDVNILLLAADTGAAEPLSARELHLARSIVAKWEAEFRRSHPEIGAEGDVARGMEGAHLTLERAKEIVLRNLRGKNDRWLCARRQPVGSTRLLCSLRGDDPVPQFSKMRYSGDRATIIVWNRGNVHWVPIAVGLNAQTVIEPDSSLRQHVDRLLS
jgi:hypothetical protein